MTLIRHALNNSSIVKLLFQYCKVTVCKHGLAPMRVNIRLLTHSSCKRDVVNSQRRSVAAVASEGHDGQVVVRPVRWDGEADVGPLSAWGLVVDQPQPVSHRPKHLHSANTCSL